MAYHDLHDNLAGFPLGAQIEIAQLKLRQYQNNEWKLQQLDFATIRSLTARSEMLKPISWQVNGGFQRVLGKNQNDVLVSQVNGGGGGSWGGGGSSGGGSWGGGGSSGGGSWGGGGSSGGSGW